MEQDTLVTRKACITLKKLKNRPKRRGKATKNQIAIDTKTQVILAHKVVRGPRHDSKDVIPTIRKTRKY
jgi:hypothetical protein